MVSSPLLANGPAHLSQTPRPVNREDDTQWAGHKDRSPGSDSNFQVPFFLGASGSDQDVSFRSPSELTLLGVSDAGQYVTCIYQHETYSYRVICGFSLYRAQPCVPVTEFCQSHVNRLNFQRERGIRASGKESRSQALSTRCPCTIFTPAKSEHTKCQRYCYNK